MPEKEFDALEAELKINLHRFRTAAEKRVLEKGKWNTAYRLKLQILSTLIFKLQVELSEL